MILPTSQLNAKLQKDLEDMNRIKAFLQAGWSINMALAKANISQGRYSALRHMHESFVEDVKKFSQHYSNKGLMVR